MQEAYDVLSDSNSRQIYDESLQDPAPGFGFDMFGRGGGARSQQPRRAPPKRKSRSSNVEITITLDELYKGKEKHLSIQRDRSCVTCTGTGAKPNSQRRQCVSCQGEGFTYITRHQGNYLTRSTIQCEACNGTGSKFRAQDSCKKCRGKRVLPETHRLSIFIERGLHPKDKLLLTGEGDEVPDSSGPGDLIISFNLLPHPTYTLLPSTTPRAPANLRTTLSLTLSESLLGFDSRLVLIHLDGRGLSAKAPAPGKVGWRVLKNGDEVRIKGEGMIKGGEKGDLIVLVEVALPTAEWANDLGPEKLALLESLLPPKREVGPEVYPEETDEISWEHILPRPEAFSSTHDAGPRPPRPDESDDEEGYGEPQCQQQ